GKHVAIAVLGKAVVVRADSDEHRRAESGRAMTLMPHMVGGSSSSSSSSNQNYENKSKPHWITQRLA
ncbi:MAG: hypothetical protein ABGZ53_22925, partial [Fuerstiella sp.]